MLRLLLVGALLTSRAFAQSDGGVSNPALSTSGSPDSPRAAVRAFLQAAHSGRFGEAARFLDLPPRLNGQQATDRAQQLSFVLARRLWIDPDEVSGAAEGNLADGLPYSDELGKLPGVTGAPPEPVRLSRVRTADGYHWLFSRTTVERVPAWYSALEERWLLDRLPPALLRLGPRDIVWWQWLAIPPLLLVAWVVGRLMGWLSGLLIARITRRTQHTWDDELAERARAPLTGAWLLLFVLIELPFLRLNEPAERFAHQVLKAATFLLLTWVAVRAVDLAARGLRQSGWANASPAYAGLLPMGIRLTKLIVLIMAGIAILSELGYPVASLLAGLGIGGLAVALAAQKTVENLFGSVSIAVDQPFRVGDFVKVDEHLGTVESVGLRSTRLRTPDRTLVTLPNGKLADARIETFAVRDRIRLFCMLGLRYETTAAQLRQVLEGLRVVLRSHPKVHPDPSVRLIALSESSMDIEVQAWFLTQDFGQFAEIREQTLLSFLEVIERAGTRLAFPSRTVYLNPPERSDGTVRAR